MEMQQHKKLQKITSTFDPLQLRACVVSYKISEMKVVLFLAPCLLHKQMLLYIVHVISCHLNGYLPVRDATSNRQKYNN